MNNQQKYLTSFCILGTVIAVILAGLGFILRALRKDLPVYDFLNFLAPFSKSYSAVGVEHFAAGVAYPLVFSIPFAIFFLYLTCTYKVRDYSINTYNRLMWTTVSLTSVYYVAHIWDHETHQAFVSVYGGPARGYIQYWQVGIGCAGVLFFCLFNYCLQRRYAKGSSSCQSQQCIAP